MERVKFLVDTDNITKYNANIPSTRREMARLQTKCSFSQIYSFLLTRSMTCNIVFQNRSRSICARWILWYIHMLGEGRNSIGQSTDVSTNTLAGPRKYIEPRVLCACQSAPSYYWSPCSSAMSPCRTTEISRRAQLTQSLMGDAVAMRNMDPSFVDEPGVDSILTSFFLFTCFVVNRQLPPAAWLRLREEVTSAAIIEAQSRDDETITVEE
ncbi:hypothetical protein V1517DRAFT_348150 [Lipomyces orientalis]|uniref:Uncharacterized protein n=1 Tax=Lipomyces orientalis TaxID=1233043 RepID=A0ACC3TH55_9ASCO